MGLVQYHLYIEKELKASLEELAKKDGRSLNNLVNKVLREFVEITEKPTLRFNPNPHGDLISREDLLQQLDMAAIWNSEDLSIFESLIKDAETVIEAST